MNIQFNEWSIGIYSIYENARIITELNGIVPSTEKVIFTGRNYKKGITKALESMYPNKWVLDSNLNPMYDLTEKSKVLDWIAENYMNIKITGKDLLCNLEWEEFSKLCKLGYYTGKIAMGRGTSIWKLYENLANGNKKERLELFYKMEDIPKRVLESMVLTFIRKSRMYDVIQAGAKYKLLLKTFNERNPKIDQILIEYAYKSNKSEADERLIWLLTTLK